MSRYQRQLRLCLPPEQVEQAVENFLLRNRFYQGQWKQQDCWIADQPPARQVRFFRYSYDGETLSFSAWVRQGNEEELGLEGFQALDLQAPYRRALVELCRQLLEASPETDPQPDWLTEEQRRGKWQWVVFVLALLIAGGLIAYSMANWFPAAY